MCFLVLIVRFPIDGQPGPSFSLGERADYGAPHSPYYFSISSPQPCAVGCTTGNTKPRTFTEYSKRGRPSRWRGSRGRWYPIPPRLGEWGGPWRLTSSSFLLYVQNRVEAASTKIGIDVVGFFFYLIWPSKEMLRCISDWAFRNNRTWWWMYGGKIQKRRSPERKWKVTEMGVILLIIMNILSSIKIIWSICVIFNVPELHSLCVGFHASDRLCSAPTGLDLCSGPSHDFSNKLNL